jgi:hypothetical protein
MRHSGEKALARNHEEVARVRSAEPACAADRWGFGFNAIDESA